MAASRVLVTRAAEDAEPLCAALRAHNLEPVVVALLERRSRPGAFEAIDWDSFDWLLLTSSATVDALVDANAPRNARVRIGAIGQTTAERAIAAGFRVDIVPPSSTGADLVDALGDVAGLAVLYPHAAEIESNTAEALRASGARLTEIVAYENVEPPDIVARLREVWPVDVVTLLSGSAARRFSRAREAAALPLTARIVVLGPSTDAVARACGLPVDSVAHPQTIEGVAAACRRTLEHG
jgi:uroporphyrinogen-III synthase